MDVGRPGWFSALVRHAAAAPLSSPPALTVVSTPGRAMARAHLRRFLRENGVLYGTPAVAPSVGRDGGDAPSARGANEDVLFVALMRVFCRMATELAALTREKRVTPEELLVLFAAFTGQWDELEEIQEVIETGLPSPLRRAWSRVEEALSERAMSLSGNPVYGLVLHNGALYADAELFGRHAIALFSRGGLSRVSGRRRNEVSARQKALLVQVLTALSCAERPPPYSARRAILRQVEDLQLPPALESRLRAQVKAAFEHRVPLETLTGQIRSDDMKRFIVEQTVLASLVDGHRSPKELAFLQSLASAVGFGPERVQKIEAEMAHFYRQNRQVVDVFTVSEAASVLDDELIGSVQSSVEKNYEWLMHEVKKTRELSGLLARAARGHSLSSDERRQMREQLIDLAKVVPALAIFAAPGGLFLLIALAKVLPSHLLPSALRPQEDAALEDELAEG